MIAFIRELVLRPAVLPIWCAVFRSPANLGGGVSKGVPAELGPSGRDLYESLLGGREVSAAHRSLVINAARLADKADELSEAVGGRLTTINSQGTETINPLISELRMVTAGLAAVLSKLGVGELPKVRSGEKTIRDQLAERRAMRVAGGDEGVG